jgi:palmitoyltransferase ZDHHC13/17
MESDPTQLDILTCARQGNIGRIRALIESGRASATDRDDDGITPLHLAAISGRVTACVYLIEQGAQVNAFGGSPPATPLQWAARKGLVEIMDLLMQHGANPNLVDPHDFSCLHSVTHSSDRRALLYILCQPGIEVNERDYMGLTPLHWAVQQDDEDSTLVLVKCGADPNAVDRNGLTALHWAASAGNSNCITQLLEAGADIRAKNRDRHTAQEMADRYHNRRTWKRVVGSLDSRRMGRGCADPLARYVVVLVLNVHFLSGAGGKSDSDVMLICPCRSPV